MRVSALILSAALIGLSAGAASADEIQLTAAERVQVSEACKAGMPLIPVQSDFGYETGEYAVPISERGGEINSAWILSENILKDISDCRVMLDVSPEQQQPAGENAAIS